MPTLNEVAGGMLDNAIKNPRSTVGSVLTAVLTGVPMLLATGLIHGKVAGVLGGILAAAKIGWGAFVEKDAQRALAKVPGDPVPQMVPAHDIPDDPKNKVVITTKP